MSPGHRLDSECSAGRYDVTKGSQMLFIGVITFSLGRSFDLFCLGLRFRVFDVEVGVSLGVFVAHGVLDGWLSRGCFEILRQENERTSQRLCRRTTDVVVTIQGVTGAAFR